MFRRQEESWKLWIDEIGSPMKRLIRSFYFAFSGLRAAFRTELNLKIYRVITILLLICSFYFRLATWEWTALLLTIGIMYVC